MRRGVCGFALVPVISCFAQVGLTVTPKQLTFQMVAADTTPASQKISITGAGSWTTGITGIGKDLLTLSPSSGTLPSTVMVTPAAAILRTLPAGGYPATLSISSPSGSATVDVVLSIVPRGSPPLFSYLSGPNFCTTPDGYDDAAACTVPNERPPGNFTPPSTGGSYVDPNFGATVRILTEPDNIHWYSTPSPFSAGNKYVMIATSGGSILYTDTGQVAFPNITANFGGTVWDAYDSEVYYFLSGASIQKVDLRTGKTSALIDFATDGHHFTSITTGGIGDTSKDNWWAVVAPNEQNVCAIDLNKVKTYCANYTESQGNVPYRGLPKPMISRGVDSISGKRYVLIGDGSTAIGFFSVNMNTGKLDLEYRGPEVPELSPGNNDGICDPGEVCYTAGHSDVFEDSKGIQYILGGYISQDYQSYTLTSFQINKGKDLLKPAELGGGRKVITTLFTRQCSGCGPGTDVYWTDQHYGCAKHAPYCVISTQYFSESSGNIRRDPQDVTPIIRTPHQSEIMVMRENGVEIRRLMENRSVPFTNESDSSYYTKPRAAISGDGKYVIADTNFGFPAGTVARGNGTRVVLVTTGFSKPAISENGITNAADSRAKLSPGAIATIYGSDLANCQLNVNTFPLPDTVCGLQVTFNGVPGLFLYASQGQLNVAVPQALPVQSDINVVVRRESDASDPFVITASNFLEEGPAIFSLQNSDYSLNGPGGPGRRPLRLGEAGIIYANALGPTDSQVPDGQPGPSDPPAKTLRPVQVFINDVPQTVFFSGLVPGLANVYQVNFVLDPSTPINDGDNNFLWLNVNGVESPRLLISLAPA